MPTRLRRNQKARPKKNVPQNPRIVEPANIPAGIGSPAFLTSRTVSTTVGDANAHTVISRLAAATRSGSELRKPAHGSITVKHKNPQTEEPMKYAQTAGSR